MSREVLLLVDALAREKNVDKEIVFGALEAHWPLQPKNALAKKSGCSRQYDRNTGEYKSYRCWK